MAVAAAGCEAVGAASCTVAAGGVAAAGAEAAAGGVDAAGAAGAAVLALEEGAAAGAAGGAAGAGVSCAAVAGGVAEGVASAAGGVVAAGVAAGAGVTALATAPEAAGVSDAGFSGATVDAAGKAEVSGGDEDDDDCGAGVLGVVPTAAVCASALETETVIATSAVVTAAVRKKAVVNINQAPSSETRHPKTRENTLRTIPDKSRYQRGDFMPKNARKRIIEESPGPLHRLPAPPPGERPFAVQPGPNLLKTEPTR